MKKCFPVGEDGQPLRASLGPPRAAGVLPNHPLWACNYAAIHALPWSLRPTPRSAPRHQCPFNCPQLPLLPCTLSDPASPSLTPTQIPWGVGECGGVLGPGGQAGGQVLRGFDLGDKCSAVPLLYEIRRAAELIAACGAPATGRGAACPFLHLVCSLPLSSCVLILSPPFVLIPLVAAIAAPRNQVKCGLPSFLGG